MKKLKRLLVLYVFLVLPLFIMQYLYCVLTATTTPKNNTFTINDKTSYTVIHQTMDLNGTTYTTVLEEPVTGVTLGSSVTPGVKTYEGFNSPSPQTVTINTYNNNVITYQYTRKQFNLTVNDSQYTTGTQSGTYYYGTPIHLVANEYDSSNKPFAKWSDESTERDYTFTLTGDKTIGPIYSNLHQVTFEPNNGDQATTRNVIENQKMGTPPTVTNNDCVTDTGTYKERQCTYYYEFKGWFLEPDFQTEVNGDYVPTENVTIYAKWNKLYYHNDSATFTGNSLIDTGIQLFNEENADRDFTVEFTVEDFPSGQAARTAVFANMKETGEPYSGVQFRYFNNRFNINANVDGNKKNTGVNYTLGNKVILKRENGLFSYSLDGGNTFTYYNDYTMFTDYFDVNATFGGEYDANGNEYRYMSGTLSDMNIELSDYDTYTIHFDPNGGTGMTVDQNVKVDKTVKLNANNFTYEDYMFDCWNTAADGSGTTYTNKQNVTGLGQDGDVITLYAQWKEPINYYVHFDANGGTGTMPNQTFIYNDDPVALNPSLFTKTGYMFMGWNTEADGSGTSYADQEEVRNLTDVEDDIVILYAQYMRIAFIQTGSTQFGGVANDMIDTGVNLYTQQTIDKDFEIRFTVNAIAPDNLYQNQATILSCKDESNPKWPGLNVRFPTSGNNKIQINYKWKAASGGSTTAAEIPTNNLPIEIIIRRINKVVTAEYKYQGFESGEVSMYDQTKWTLDQYFADNITFGGIYDSTHQPDRFFKGTLSDMVILIKD